MEELPVEIIFNIGDYLSLTDLRRLGQVNRFLSHVGLELLKRRLAQTSIMVVSFITYYIDEMDSDVEGKERRIERRTKRRIERRIEREKEKEKEKEEEKEEVICKIYLGPVTRAERDSLVNNSTIIRSSDSHKFVTRSPFYRFNRVEISEILLGKEVSGDDLLPVLLGTQPLFIERESRLTPTSPIFSPSSFISTTSPLKKVIQVKPQIHYRQADPVTKREKNRVVYHLAFDGQSEFFTNLEN